MSNVPPTPSGLRGAVDLSSLVDRAQRPASTPATSGTPASAAPSGGPAAGADGAADLTVPSLVLDVTDQTFQDVLQLSTVVPVIVDIWAEWCGPCKQLSPILEQLTAEYDGRVLLAKVDADTNPQLVQAFQAQSIPTVAALIGGRPLGLFVGALPEAQVRDVYEQVLAAAEQNGVSGRVAVDGAAPAEAGEQGEPEPEPLPPHHQAAYDAIERGDYATAVQEYKTAIAQDPHDQMAVAGLAQVSLLDRLQGHTADEIRAAAAAGPDDVDAQLGVADLDISGGHVEDAFGRLLDLVPTVFGADRERVRVRLVEYFELVGSDDPRVVAARRRLANALY